MISYLSEKILPLLFRYISERYARAEEVPDYSLQRSGIEKLRGVLEGVKADTFYPTLQDKAVYLITQINKGHFFSNGNKRLALVLTTVFLGINNHELRQTSKEEYAALIKKLFPEYGECEDFPEFTPADFGTYHLSVVVADSGALGISYEDLKTRVHHFFAETLERVDGE